MSDVKKSTINWLKIAEKDLRYAKLCLDDKEPLGTISHLHASVEKTLKGFCSESIGIPPKIHSLKKLAIDVCKVELKEKQLKFLNLLDSAFIDSRYPDDIDQFEKDFDLKYCTKIYAETKELIKCLKNIMS